MITSGINLVMTVIGFSVSTMFIVFVCTRLVCARIHLNSSRRSFPIASRPDLSALERGGLHGLEPVVAAKFPTKKYSDDYFSAVKDSQCTICLADYCGEDLLRILPYCAHSFHVACIDIWLVQHSTCPVCRISLREAPEIKRVMDPLFSSAVQSHSCMESDIRSYRCLLTRNLENHTTNRIREDDCESGINEAGGRGNSLSIPRENLLWKEPENKNVESPSNALSFFELRCAVYKMGLKHVNCRKSLKSRTW